MPYSFLNSIDVNAEGDENGQVRTLGPPSYPTSPSAVAPFIWFEDAPALKEVLVVTTGVASAPIPSHSALSKKVTGSAHFLMKFGG